MQAKVYNQDGTVAETIELDPAIFGVTAKAGLIEQAVNTHLANRRQAIAHTKTRGEVRGGGRKPWKQKGTGRARQGSIRSPQWKGGGVVFGPRNSRVFSRKMNIHSKRLALLMTLSEKAKQEQLTILKELVLPAAKTKEFMGVMKKFPAAKSGLIITAVTDQNLIRASRNVPRIEIIRADSLNTYDILRHQRLTIMQAALPIIKRIYAK